MKKFLAVATALVLAISSLCVFVVADDAVEIDGTTYEVIFSEDCSVASGNWNSFTLSNSSSLLSALQTEGAYLVITRDSEPSSFTYDNMKFGDTWYSGTSVTLDLTAADIGSGTVLGFLATDVYDAWVDGGNSNGGDPLFISNTDGSYTITNISVVAPAEEETTVVLTETATISSAASGGTTAIVNPVTSAWYEALTTEGATLTLTFTVSGDYSLALAVQQTSGSWGGSWWTVSTSGSSDGSEPVTFSWGDISALSGSEYLISGDSQILVNVVSGELTDVTLTVVAETTSSKDEDGDKTASGVTGTIYINEEYHGMFIVRNGKKFMISIPHTVGDDGYCTVCHEYIGTDGDVATTDINGGEYVVAYTSDINLSSGSWASKDLGDTSILDALATEGAILVVTRDSEQNIVFSSEETIYEKFVLVNSWYSGDTVQLGTAGHTSADEDGIIDCISDDGTVAMYDGNTIYDTWVANGLNAGGTVLFISNTSSTDYKFANVTVYVPAGSTTVEDVDVTEPAEPTDTETEDDGTDDVEVTENETTADTNPTTGVVLALVPMAIAGFAAVASKRK